MKVEYINPFIESSIEVISQMTGLTPTTGKVYVKNTPYNSASVLVMIGLAGNIHGNVVINFDAATACKMSSLMMGGMEVLTLDELAKSAIGELCNMILGRSSVMFSERNIMIDITPPTVITGENLQLSIHKSVTICVPVVIDQEVRFELDISYTEK